ncbi:hypothetical protein Fmac_027256 [Flemingia macrophylla]|uniref:Uncharacterized protein n=1 Tax=Flemingia macrophylla TaxID=520843 RepID=A0ABD1LHC0_9FABA
MDERINLSMSDPDLVPLLVQENYINYRPSSAGKDDSGIKRMNMIARAAESIADADIVNVQIRRYRQWQLSQTMSRLQFCDGCANGRDFNCDRCCDGDGKCRHVHFATVDATVMVTVVIRISRRLR